MVLEISELVILYCGTEYDVTSSVVLTLRSCFSIATGKTTNCEGAYGKLRRKRGNNEITFHFHTAGYVLLLGHGE
jgi:hypothetical protein